MEQYTILHMQPASEIRLAGAFDPDHLPEAFRPLREVRIDRYPWDENGYRPEAFARAGWDERGIHLLLAAREEHIRAQVDEVGGPVCQDSCLEFFLRPVPERSMKYVNVEASPRAVLHVGLGDGRHGRTVLRTLPEGFSPSVSTHQGAWWAVCYTLPADFLREYFGMDLAVGEHMTGNFYKCGDLTACPHYGMWTPYALPAADFHRPELFGEMVLG